MANNITVPVPVRNDAEARFITSIEEVAGKYGTYYAIFLVNENGETRRVHARQDEYRDIVGPYIDGTSLSAGPWTCYSKPRRIDGEIAMYEGKVIRDLVFKPWTE